MNRELDHFPIEKKSHRAKCALHRWGAEEEVYSPLFCCGDCKVHLCEYCYPIFHRRMDIVEAKNEIFPDKEKET